MKTENQLLKILKLNKYLFEKFDKNMRKQKIEKDDPEYIIHYAQLIHGLLDEAKGKSGNDVNLEIIDAVNLINSIQKNYNSWEKTKKGKEKLSVKFNKLLDFLEPYWQKIEYDDIKVNDVSNKKSLSR